MIDLISQSTDLLQNMKRNTDHFRQEMTRAGFKISGDNHPICPVMLGDAKLAGTFADKMLGTFIFILGCCVKL